MKTKLEPPELKSGNNSRKFFSCDFDKKTFTTSVQELNHSLIPLRIVRKPNLFLIISFLTILLFTSGCAVMCDVADILLETTPPPPTQIVIVNHPPFSRTHYSTQHHDVSHHPQAGYFRHHNN